MRKRRFFFREPALIALQSLGAHKLRSFLTLLGLILAVATLTGVVSVVEGMNRYFAERIANMGSNVFYVQRYPIITNLRDFMAARRRNPKLTLDDYEYLRENLMLAELVGAREFQRANVRYGKQNILEVSLRGVTANMIDITPEKVGMGRYFTEGEFERRALVAFIGADLREQLFPNVDPLGKTLLIDGRPVRIIGVAEELGSAFGQSQDNFVYVPLTTLHKYWGRGNPTWTGVRVGIKCSNPAVMMQAKEEARTLMRIRRGLKYDEEDNFGIVESESLTRLWDNLVGGLFTGAILIVSVFLLVGGMVIMNIMLASVTERTREIGVRKAIGARRRDIVWQFLSEAMTLTVLAGVLAVGVSYGISTLIRQTVPNLPSYIPTWAVVLGVSVAAGTGLFFGLYPAVKAARLDPVDALRYE
ncbi:ABC transporter permease [Acidobacteriia bacterium AH_259_A11_L15]|nr:ABC transporter permease [Acidobacteriia bacterium AH_259_A11_L15]